MEQLSQEQISEIKKYLMVAKRCKANDYVRWRRHHYDTSVTEVLEMATMAYEDMYKINNLIETLSRRDK